MPPRKPTPHMPRKCSVSAPVGLRPRVYPLLQSSVESGIQWGWHYAHKWEEHPDEATLKDRIADEVMNAILEAFAIEEDPEA